MWRRPSYRARAQEPFAPVAPAVGYHKTVRGFVMMVPAPGVSLVPLAALVTAGPGMAGAGLA